MHSRKNVIYLNCNYIPPEIISAAGLEPVRLWPEGIGQEGQELLPSDFCPYTRGLLSSIIDREERVVFAGSCDCMRRTYDILTDRGFFLQVPLQSSPGAVDFYYRELLNLTEFLGTRAGDPDYRDALVREIKNYNERRRLLTKLNEELIAKKISYNRLFNAAKIFGEGNPDDIKGVLQAAVNTESPAYSDQPGVLIVSSSILDEGIIKLVEKNNLVIRGLETCPGERLFDFRVEVDEDAPLRGLARAYLSQLVCPRMMEPERRFTRIYRLVKMRDVDGLLYFLPKFCDQASYDYKMIKDRIDKLGLPVLKIEGDYGSASSGRLETRIAAFRESLVMIRGD